MEMINNKLKVLFVSGELIAGDLAYRLKNEGCEVKLYIEDDSRRDCFNGIIEKTYKWKNELKWVGKDGLIIFDDVGYGKEQDELRTQGYNVAGGSMGGDELEEDRNYGQKIFSACGIKIVPSSNFSNINDAIKFVRKQGGKWVIKQDGHLGFLNYVGNLDSGEDVVSVLENYKKYPDKIKKVNLQKKIEGIEIGIARYFNGNNWIGPIEYNIEHKDLCNNDIGPKTGEMGTIMWLDDDENKKLYKETLFKLEAFLRHSNFKGNVDINCIINEKDLFPIEATTRFGCPAVQLQSELFISPWNEFLMAIAKGEEYDMKYKKGFGIVVSVAIPPFPYKSVENDYYLKDVVISFKNNPTMEEFSHIHFEEVSQRCDGKYCIAGSNGYILYVSYCDEDILLVRKKVYEIIDNIIIPKMFYRTDIGLKFAEKDRNKLEQWGWI